jgi:hypothetical protein
MLLTKGTANAAAPMAPAQLDAISQVRLLESIAVESTRLSLMEILGIVAKLD